MTSAKFLNQSFLEKSGSCSWSVVERKRERERERERERSVKYMLLREREIEEISSE